jgi:RHS repeat-associated protein
VQSVYDQVGSLRLVIDSSGEVQRRIDYDTFGYVTGDTNQALDVPFGFAGGIYDPETRLCRFGYRDYDTDTGRWTAKDPIFFAGGDTNLYGYCVGDPMNWVDPEGMAGGYIRWLRRAVRKEGPDALKDIVKDKVNDKIGDVLGLPTTPWGIIPWIFLSYTATISEEEEQRLLWQYYNNVLYQEEINKFKKILNMPVSDKVTSACPEYLKNTR